MTTKTKLWIAIAAMVAGSTALAQQEQVPTYGPLRQPVPVPGAKPVNQPAIDALKGDGLFYISGSKVANLKASGAPGQGNRYALTETSSDARTGSVNGHIDVGSFVLNGERRSAGVHRHPVVRSVLRRTAVGCVPPVLRALPRATGTHGVG